ncbi:glycosyltransferase [Paenibacillus sp. TH7-28]
MKFSVLINNYNYAKYVAQAIESVSHKDAEIIVYDDGSTDNSLEILDSFGENIKVISKSNYNHTPNENQANAIYEAFLQSSGEIICLLDSDDMFVADKLHRIGKVFDADPSVTTVQNLMLEVNSCGGHTNIIRPILKEVGDIKNYIFETRNFFHLFVPTSGLSFRRSFLERVLPLKEDGLDYIWPDMRLSLLSVFYGKIHTILEPLTYYRIHGENDSHARGTLLGHSKYLEQVYIFFNGLAKSEGYPTFHFSREVYLENTYFYMNLDYAKLISFCASASRVIIWGAGEAGQSIAHFLLKKGILVDGFIDANRDREGEEIMGLKVSLPVLVKGIKYIVSPIHAYESIKIKLKSDDLIEDTDFINPYIQGRTECTTQ